MLFLLEYAEKELLFNELLKCNFRYNNIYDKSKKILIIYLKNIGYEYI